MTHTNIKTDSDSRFAHLGTPGRVWAVSAIHGELNRLEKLHDHLFERIRPGDRIIYLGNYLGHGNAPCAVIDELLTFRRMVLAMPGMLVDDLVYLRGNQEEMWQKTLQLHFSPNPVDDFVWMLGNGVASTLEDYGFDAHDGIEAAREGCVALARWTGKIRQRIRSKPGHEIFQTHLKRAGHTNVPTPHPETIPDAPAPMLFVNAGINPSENLERQGDSFWWSRHDFQDITREYDPFKRVIRGYDPKHKGMHINCVTATIDGGCGFGGSLVAAGFDQEANVIDILDI